MVLYDAGTGDVIDIPAHHPRRVTVTGWKGGFGVSAWIWGKMAGDLAQFSWSADGGWSGVTSMSEAAVIELVRKAGPDDPIRRQCEDRQEAALAALLASKED